MFAGGVHIDPAGFPGAPLHRGEAAVHWWRPSEVWPGGPAAGGRQQGISPGAAQDTHQERGSLLWVCEAAGVAAPSTPSTPACCHAAPVPVWGLTLFVRYACPPLSPPPPPSWRPAVFPRDPLCLALPFKQPLAAATTNLYPGRYSYDAWSS